MGELSKFDVFFTIIISFFIITTCEQTKLVYSNFIDGVILKIGNLGAWNKRPKGKLGIALHCSTFF